MNSFKGYGKVDPVEDSAFRRSTRKRLLIIFISVLLLLFLLLGVSIALFLRHSRSSSSSPSSSSSSTSLSNAIEAVCSLTLHPDSCVSTLSSSNSSDPQDLFDLSLHAALSSLPDHLSKWAVNRNDSRLRGALEICGESIRDSADLLNSSLSMLRGHDKVLKESAAVADLRTYLSAVLTNLDTCVEGFEWDGGLREKVKATLGNSTELASNSLAIVTHVSQLLKQLGVPVHRKLLATMMDEEEPWWVGRGRALLQEGKEEEEKVNVTVAQDGSGDVKTIGEALAKVPKKSERAFLMRVKAGKYVEVVRVEKHMWNVVMVGDGKGKSVVTGSRNYADGIPTFNTASFGEYSS